MRAFFDSNVVVYALGGDDPRRQWALDLIAKHSADKTLVLSTQVLLESFHVLTGNRHRAPRAEVIAALRLLARQRVVAPDTKSAFLAMELAAQHQLSTWDAHIVQAALESGCGTLFSEDLQDGRRFRAAGGDAGALHIVNPFVLGVQDTAAADVLPAVKARRRRPAPR